MSDYLAEFYGRGPGEAMLKELAGVHYTLLDCSDCGLLWQRHAPADDLVERLYERWIDPSESLARDADTDLVTRVPLVQEILQIVDAMARPPGRLRVFDFGMGWGRWLLIARGIGCQVTGSEISQARLEHARALSIPTIAWDEIPGSDFDVINTEQVFEHLVDPVGTLAHLAQGLAPDGLLKISVPPNEDIHRRLRFDDWRAPKFTSRSLNAVAPLEHLNCYHGRSLVAMAERAGLVPTYLPLRAYYRYTLPAGRPKSLARQLAKPVYRSTLKRGAYRFFRRVTND